jgi:hypothetical protein
MAIRIVFDGQHIEGTLTNGEHKPTKAVEQKPRMAHTQRDAQLKILGLFGSIDYDAGYDYKAQRRRERGISATRV